MSNDRIGCPIRVSDLHPDPTNPRRISAAQQRMLARGMSEFSDISGVVYNRRNGHLVCGHQRIDMMKKAGGSDWPIIVERTFDPPDTSGTVAEGYIETPWGRWTCRVVDWDDKREKTAEIAANKYGGEFNIPLLKDALVGLDDGAFDMELTGFDADELKELIDYSGPSGADGDGAGKDEEAGKVKCPKCGNQFKPLRSRKRGVDH